MSEALNIRLNHNKADEFRNDPHTHPQKWSPLIYSFLFSPGQMKKEGVRPGRDPDPSPPSSAEGRNRVEL